MRGRPVEFDANAERERLRQVVEENPKCFISVIAESFLNGADPSDSGTTDAAVARGADGNPLSKVMDLSRPPTQFPAAILANRSAPDPTRYSTPKVNVQLVPSTKVAPAKILKLKIELFNIFFALPEKSLKWPESGSDFEEKITKAGDSAAAAVLASIEKIKADTKNAESAQLDAERLADKASRKAKRRLRRKLFTDKFVSDVQQAVTSEQLMRVVNMLEDIITPFVQFQYIRDALPSAGITIAEVASKIFALDRSINYSIIPSVEQSQLNCNYRLRTGFAPKCVANPLCHRFLGHIGKCVSSNIVQFSRVADAVTFAPAEQRAMPMINLPTAPTMNDRRSSFPVQSSQFKVLPKPMLIPEVRLFPLKMILDRGPIDIEFVAPFVPNLSEVTASEWV